MSTGRLPAGFRGDALAGILACAAFCLLTLQHLHLPGPHTDELFTAAPAVNFVEGTAHTEPMQIEPSVIRIAGRPLPLMVMTYVGGLQTFLYVPAFMIFGDSLATVRVLPILAGLLALWCSYLFWKELFDRATAVLATVFLIADPGFIFFVGRDFGPPGLALLLKMAGLLLLLRWWRGGGTAYLYGAACVWGLALYHKADFLWILAAAAIAGGLFYRHEVRTRLTAGQAGISAAVFSLSAAPFLLMNLLTAGATFRLLAPQLSVADQVVSFFAAVAVRGGQLAGMLSGEAPYRLFMGEPGEPAPAYLVVLPVLVFGGCLLLAAQAAGSRGNPGMRKNLFLLTFVTLIFLQTAKTPTSLMAHHLMALYPLMHGLAAAGIVLALERLRRYFRAGLVVAAMVAAVPGIAATGRVYGALERTGGTGYWSDAVYDLSTFLETEARPVALMQWGFTSNLIVLSRGQLTLHRVYKDLMERGTRPELIDPYIDAGTLYLFYAGDAVGYRAALDALSVSATRRGFTPEMVRLFHQRGGGEIYAVYQLRRTP